MYANPSDRELLELAAKAAGIKYIRSHDFGLILAVDQDNEPTEWWNPLADDGDALRLAVKLWIKIVPCPIYTEPKHSVLTSKLTPAPEENDESAFIGPEIIEFYHDDPGAATRRAIVRAAVEIGKAMK